MIQLVDNSKNILNIEEFENTVEPFGMMLPISWLPDAEDF